MARDFPTKTDAGRRWLIKALHPAEGSLKAERAPGNARFPTATQEVVSTFVVSAPEGTGTWDLRVVTHTNPLTPVQVFAKSQFPLDGESGEEVYLGEYVNQAFVRGVSEAFGVHTELEFESALVQFSEAAEAYRITALSTTGVFVGATMTDQGSIVSSQFTDNVMTRSTVDAASDGKVLALADLWFDALPLMSEATLGQHPYVADARKGWYAPQKLGDPLRWIPVDDLRFRGRVHPGLNPLPVAEIPHSSVVGYPNPRQGLGYWVRDCDDTCSQTFASGLDRTTTFRITVRLAVEYACNPANDYAAFCEEAKAPDDVAIDLYQEVVKEIMDAYPSEYNDFGKLFGRVKDVVRKVASVVDPVAGIAAAAGLPFASVVQNLAKAVKQGSSAYIESAAPDGLKADLQRAKEAAKAMSEAAKAKAQAKKQAKAVGK